MKELSDRLIAEYERNILSYKHQIEENKQFIKDAEKLCDYMLYKKALESISLYEGLIAKAKENIEKLRGETNVV